MGVYEDMAKDAGYDYGTDDNEEYAQMLEAMDAKVVSNDAASRRIAELEAQLAEQKEWVKDLADLNVKNEARLAAVKDANNRAWKAVGGRVEDLDIEKLDSAHHDIAAALSDDFTCPGCDEKDEAAEQQTKIDTINGKIEHREAIQTVKDLHLAECRLADIPKDVLRWIQVGGDTAELMDIVGGLDAALSDPVSRENGDIPVKRKDGE